MIARGFKPVAWVAAIGSAALGCYMLSLQVAAERAELASLDREIISTRQDIRSLQTELGTRGRLQQLEQWNAEVLALSAPVAGQFLESGLTLARFDTREIPGQVHEQVRLASAETAPTAAAASAVRPAVAQTQVAPATPNVREQPLVRRASLEITPSAKPARVVASVAASPRPAETTSLLDERTLREISAQAQSEGEQGAN
ncbi:MAG TPA: hypothetical protein VFO69_04900 [Allosphingosinicella sp.]|nr:hypothetical protein [Allosphingosinicella sp.]